MVTELQKYIGVACISCREPITLHSKAEHRYRRFEQRNEDSNDEVVVPLFRLRCYECHRESLYIPWDVIEFDGAPKERRLHKKVSPDAIRNV